MKKLIAIAVSSITYLRAIFPENAFGDRSIENLHLKILSENSGCSGACQVINWIRGSFDALEKKYLRQLMIGLYENPDEPDNVIESYTFRFSYEKESTLITCNNEKLASVSNYGIDLTKKTTLSLLRTIILLMQNLKPLPEIAYLTMKLLYYDEVTPEDYEPPGFKPADSPFFYFKSDPINIKVGDVSTPFHSLKLCVKTNKKQFDMEEEQNNVCHSEDKKQFNCEILDSNEDLIENILIEDSYDDFKNEEKNERMQLRSSQSSKKYDDETCNSKSSRTNKIQCPCGLLKEDALMLTCIACNKKQHAICFGILKRNEMPDKHYCENCQSMDQERPPTDLYLSSLNSIELQALCIWRQALMTASKSNTLTCSSLSRQLHLDVSVAESILVRLENENYLHAGKGKDRKKKIVNKKLLTTEGFSKYITRTKPIIKDKEDSKNGKFNKNKDHEEKMNILTAKTSQLSVDQIENKKFLSRGQKRTIALDKEASELEIISQGGVSDSDRSKRQKASTSNTGLSV